MDPGNRRPTQVASGAVGDWRVQLQRQRMVYKIMDTLKKNLPFYRYDRLHELKKIAQRVEHETFTAASCESEYSRKICFMMLAMETRLQNHMQSNPVTLYSSVKPSVPLDSTANGGDWQEQVYQEIKALKDLYLLDMIGQNPNGEDWQEEVYQKIKAMKDLYLPYLNYMHQKLLSRLQWHNSHPQQPENDQVEKMKRFKNMLERFMLFLQIPKHGIIANCKEKLGTYEKQIIHIIKSIRRKPVAPQQQTQSQALPPQHMQSFQQSQHFHFQFTQVQSHGNHMNLESSLAQTLQSKKMPHQQQNQQFGKFVANTSSTIATTDTAAGDATHAITAWPVATAADSTTPIDNPIGGDWQEEVYQKIKAMKDLYQLDLIVMYQKTLSILRQHHFLPWQPENVHFEKMKAFKHLLERDIQFLQTTKHGILANHKDKLGINEKQIVYIVNAKRQKSAGIHQQARV